MILKRHGICATRAVLLTVIGNALGFSGVLIWAPVGLLLLSQTGMDRTLPLLGHYVPRATLLGGDFRFDLTTIAISRRIGEDDQRLTGEARWRLPFVFDDGQLLTLQTDVRGDLYHTSNVNALGNTGLADSQFITRGAPYAALDWRWPFVSPGDQNFAAVEQRRSVRGPGNRHMPRQRKYAGAGIVQFGSCRGPVGCLISGGCIAARN